MRTPSYPCAGARHRPGAARATPRQGAFPSYHPHPHPLTLTRTLTLALEQGHTLTLALEQGHSVRELLALLDAMVARGGLDALHPRWRVGNLAMPRPLEARAKRQP